MSETFKIKSSLSDYYVHINQGGIKQFINEKSNHIIIDEKVNRLWPSLGLSSPITVEAKESNKTLSTVAYLIEKLRGNGANRASTLLAIGGGIVQDVSTFSASSYMRGVKWFYAPTTLLGMVDSCIGGKSSINVGEYKNIAGNFYPPQEIIVDVDFCKTLSEQQLIEGLSEAVKICYAHSEERFNDYLKVVNLSENLHSQDFEKVVVLSLKTKKQFIEEDEFDEGIRLLLNFGHTFGHALEGASNFAVSHGIAVGLGMISAYKLSRDLGILNGEPQRLKSLLSHVANMLSNVEGLETVLNEIDMADALKKFLSDKKHSEDQYVAILYGQDGSLVRYKFDKSPQNERLILGAFEFLREFHNEI